MKKSIQIDPAVRWLLEQSKGNLEQLVSMICGRLDSRRSCELCEHEAHSENCIGCFSCVNAVAATIREEVDSSD